MANKPNLFSFATKELAQDGFFTWLLEWANGNNANYDKALNETAKDFVKLLIQQQHNADGLEVETVKTWRQWEKIDIIAEVNGEYVITIEDKVDSCEHSGQLDYYKEKVETNYEGKKELDKLVFIYLKTGNESLIPLENVRKKGYAVIGRKDVLGVLNKRKVDNQIFLDFKDHLTEIENKTNACETLENITSDGRAAEGFFLKLQEKKMQKCSNEDVSELLGKVGDWRYVATPTGGFLGFWYYWRWNKKYNCTLNIQIENAYEYGIRLVIKIADCAEASTDLFYTILADMQNCAKDYGLKLEKPSRFKVGGTSTLAVVENAFPDNFNIDDFITKLEALENMIDEFCETKS
jgi:hypothetical protein